jgi:Kdo2-lipid IVA lauroyltransferase/acyltransferase
MDRHDNDATATSRSGDVRHPEPAQRAKDRVQHAALVPGSSVAALPRQDRRTRVREVMKLRHAAEYAGVMFALGVVRALPLGVLRALVGPVASLGFVLLRRRRALAVDNVRHALGPEVTEVEARRVALASLCSFLLTAIPEVAKLAAPLTAGDREEWLRASAPELEALFARARALHDETHGCVFVTPHLGNWELLPFVSAALGIPLVVAVRPLDNPLLERRLLQSRTSTGQVFVAQRNSLWRLQTVLRQGKSVGLLPDQAAMKGLKVEFLGREALTSPVPALLALYSNRPLVVVACFRTAQGRFAGHVGDPIWPRAGGSDREEAQRLTQAMNSEMGTLVREHPEQYFWLHNRWKSYD